jgi:hypothetical protein
MFKTYYRKRFREILGEPLEPSDGLGEQKVQRALRKRSLVIPRALAEYYAIAGRHEINARHNRLLPIGELAWEGEKLVFMEENQCVALWGIDKAAIEDSNPVVWQGPNNEPIEWYEEPYCLSQFLMAMWHWQETGVEEEPETP